MRLQKSIVRETVRISVGTIVLAIIMNLVFLIINMWDLTVLYGTLLGCTMAIANFLLLGITVQIIANNQDSEKRNKLKLQLSYSLRMLALLAGIAIGVSSPYFMWVCVVLPVFFPRITIALMQIFGIYKPEKKQNLQNNTVQEGD